MKKPNEIIHFEQIMGSIGYESDRWKECYMSNFRDYGYDDVPGYVQATLDFLRTKGYKIVENEDKNVEG